MKIRVENVFVVLSAIWLWETKNKPAEQGEAAGPESFPKILRLKDPSQDLFEVIKKVLRS